MTGFGRQGTLEMVGLLHLVHLNNLTKSDLNLFPEITYKKKFIP